MATEQLLRADCCPDLDARRGFHLQLWDHDGAGWGGGGRRSVFDVEVGGEPPVRRSHPGSSRCVPFRSRPLGDRRWLVLYINGFGFGDETLIGALGVEEKGNKTALSVIHGTTENKAACTRLLDDLEARGFDPSEI